MKNIPQVVSQIIVLSGLVRIRRSFFLIRFGELQMGIFLRQKFYERGIEILIN